MSLIRLHVLTLSTLLLATATAHAATPLYNPIPNAAAAASAATANTPTITPSPLPAPAQQAPVQQTVAVPVQTPVTQTITPSPAPAAGITPSPVQTAITTTTPPITGAAATSEAMQHGKMVGSACPGKWDSAACLSAVSNSNLSLAANFGTALQQKGLNDDAEQVKQHCAASTAAREKSFPAYAMKSAFIECANLIADTSARTGVQPDLSEYQLLVGATMCLDSDVRCKGISDQLQAIAK